MLSPFKKFEYANYNNLFIYIVDAICENAFCKTGFKSLLNIDAIEKPAIHMVVGII